MHTKIFGQIRYWSFALVALSVLVAACGGGDGEGGSATATPQGGGPLKFIDNGWDTNNVSSAIAMFIVEHGYEVDVAFTQIDSQEEFQTAIVEGTADVIMELWQSEYEKWYGIAEQREQIGDRGELYDEGQAGWFVPTYVLDANPDAGNIETLGSVASVFGGEFISCPVAWPCDRFNQVKLDTYGLSGDFTVSNPTTNDELEQRLSTAYAAGESVIGYFREPSWLLESQDWTRVEEPDYGQLCWARLNNFITGERDELTAACAYPETEIETALYRGIFGTRQELPPLFFHMTFGKEPLMAAVRNFHETGGTLEQAAVYFLKNEQPDWRGWIAEDTEGRADIIARVEAALAAR